MHKREDHPGWTPRSAHHLVSAGLDEVKVTVRPAADRSQQELAA